MRALVWLACISVSFDKAEVAEGAAGAEESAIPARPKPMRRALRSALMVGVAFHEGVA